jgi:hypothetical protein
LRESRNPGIVVNVKIRCMGLMLKTLPACLGKSQWRAQFLDEHGQLKPNYRPAPMVASFMQEPAVALREQMPVPKGPVNVW